MPKDNGLGPDSTLKLKWSYVILACSLIIAITMNYAALVYHDHDDEYVPRGELAKEIEAMRDKVDTIYDVVMREYGRPEP